MRPCTLRIESLDNEGRGVARRDGKVVFVEGALPGESVTADVYQEKSRFALAQLVSVVRPSAQRRPAPCPYALTCGGCSLQTLEFAAQVAVKQRVLEDSLQRIGGVRAACILPPLQGSQWHYRQRARLAVRVRPDGSVHIGFRQQGSHEVTDVRHCMVLPGTISRLLPDLHDMLSGLVARTHIKDISLAAGDAANALVLHHDAPLDRKDIQTLQMFGAAHHIHWWLQPSERKRLHPLHPDSADALYYALPEFGLRMPFRPLDFFQANLALNRVLISKAVQMLDVTATARVADFFCGLGNFSLPLATKARQVVGVEGSRTLTERATQAAKLNHLHDKLQFLTTDLFSVDVHWLRRQKRFDRVLLDPPRDGAQALCLALAQLAPREQPTRIVYVSCNPATLARDAGILSRAYHLKAAGIVNMFPHTNHVESIAVFDRMNPAFK